MNSTEPTDARAHLAAIVASSDDAIIGKTLDGMITSWNAAAERIFGYSSDEARGQHISLIIPSDRLDEEYIVIGKVKAGQRIDHFETVRRAKDGTLIDISLTVSPIRNADGVIVGASKVARDIRIARTAERLEAYVAAIVDSSDDAIISKDLSGVITSWNASAARVFGYTAAEAIGQHITLIIPPELIDEEFMILSRVRAGERVEHFETRRRTKAGDMVDISLTVSPIRNRSGLIIGASKVARDVTEQKRMIARFAESNRRKDEFMANMSHELRTPLNAVIGLAHILSKSDRLSSKEQQCVTMIRQSGDNLLELINNLLDFSRLETQQMAIEAVEFDLPELVEQTVVLLDTAIRDKGLRIEVAYRGALSESYVGDPMRLRQILTNLVSNAVKFTERGVIDVTVGLKSVGEGRSVLSFEVADTGVGIAGDKLPSIFDKFTQADASTARTHGGSGLGLSICKALAEAMGGSIAVTSTLGLGSAFTVELPFGHASQAEPLAAARQDDVPAHNILIVEDYEPNIMVLSSVLDDLGYSYDVARNGMEAVRKSERGRYGAILMDVQMPGMDGFDCTRRLRDSEQRKQAPRTPIIALTALVTPADRERCLSAGMDDFIPKPFDPKRLEHVLSGIIVAAR